MQRQRTAQDEREEIEQFVGEQPEATRETDFNERPGRLPVGPARGWRAREQRAKSCDLCEGDLWVEGKDGTQVPCECRQRRSGRRANNRMRAGGWWRGTSLSFAAPPLASVPVPVRDAVERLCTQIKNQPGDQGLWVVGGPGLGKSALCAYLAQRLYPTNDVIAERTGDLLAHLRWLGAVKGELAVEKRMQTLMEVPLLVLDDIDRPIRSHTPSSPLALQASLGSRDLIRLSGLLRDRRAELRPIVVTSRCQPYECAERSAAVTRDDLVRGLVATASGTADPFEDFPSYSQALLLGAIRELEGSCTAQILDAAQSDAMAA